VQLRPRRDDTERTLDTSAVGISAERQWHGHRSAAGARPIGVRSVPREWVYDLGGPAVYRGQGIGQKSPVLLSLCLVKCAFGRCKKSAQDRQNSLAASRDIWKAVYSIYQKLSMLADPSLVRLVSVPGPTLKAPSRLPGAAPYFCRWHGRLAWLDAGRGAANWEARMRDHNWVRVVAIAAGVAILLLLLGPTTVHPDPVDRGTAGRSILAGVAPAGVRA